MNEFELLLKYEYEYEHNNLKSVFDTISNAIHIQHTELLNLEISKRTCDEAFEYLFILNRYKEFKSNNKIWYTEKGFHIHDYIFQSLDEIETAINNKMFL